MVDPLLQRRKRAYTEDHSPISSQLDSLWAAVGPILCKLSVLMMMPVWAFERLEYEE